MNTPFSALAIDPSGNDLITGGQGPSCCLDGSHLKPVNRLEPIEVPKLRRFAFSHQDNLLATTEPQTDDEHKRIVCLRTGDHLESRIELPELGDQVVDIAFSSDGRYLAGLSRDAVRLWDVQNEQLVKDEELRDKRYKLIVGFTRNNDHLLLVDRTFTVTFWDTAAGQIEDDVWHTSGPHLTYTWWNEKSIAFHAPSGTLVFGGDRSATVLDFETRETRGVLRGQESVSDLTRLFPWMDPSSQRPVGSVVSIWDSKSLEEISQFDAHQGINCVTFTASNRPYRLRIRKLDPRKHLRFGDRDEIDGFAGTWRTDQGYQMVP